jgi:DMSO/TMAO reductase YedYZ heme-binding membrane subunit
MEILKSKHLNGWSLLYWMIGINSAAVIAYMPTQDLSGPVGVSEMIQMTVRWSVPLLFLAFATPAMNILFPSKFTRWLLRNSRSIGLSYAAAMGWQLFFILWMWAGHWEYYTGEVYLLGDIIFQVPGYLVIFAMTITSFAPVRRRMSAGQWRVLHKMGIYFLWFILVDTYYYELTYYGDIQVIDYIYLVAGLLAYLMRVAAWSRLRVMQAANT